MIPDAVALQKAGWTIERIRCGRHANASEVLALEWKFEAVWHRLGPGSRWLVLDQLRRFLAAPNQERCRVRHPCMASIGLSTGNFRFERRSDRKDGNHVRLSYVNETRFECWPNGIEALQSKKAKFVTIADLVASEHARPPRPLSRCYEDIDPLARELSGIIPAGMRQSVLQAISDEQFEANLTGPGGNLEEDGWIGLGVQHVRKRRTIVPIGRLSEKIYFQNGWLMMKIEGNPESVKAGLISKSKPGLPASDILDISIPDGRGSLIRPLEGMKIADARSGTTWMGKHLQLRFENSSDKH